MTSTPKNLSVLFGVFVPTALACFLYLNTGGHTDDNLNTLLRWTARMSFVIYLVIFVARPLRQLLANGTTNWLLKERRSLGISFAAMHSVHLALIACRFNTVPNLEFEVLSGVFGVTAYALMYLMLITSFDAPARAIGRHGWRILHKTGLYFLGLIFVATLLPDPGDEVFTFDRMWFFALAGGAVLIRLTAFFARRKARST